MAKRQQLELPIAVGAPAPSTKSTRKERQADRRHRCPHDDRGTPPLAQRADGRCICKSDPALSFYGKAGRR